MSALFQLLDSAVSGWADARRWLAFWGPVTTSPASVLVGPLLALASVLSLALLTGLAVGSLATLLVTLVVLYLLLTEVFGISVDLQIP